MRADGELSCRKNMDTTEMIVYQPEQTPGLQVSVYTGEITDGLAELRNLLSSEGRKLVGGIIINAQSRSHFSSSPA